MATIYYDKDCNIKLLAKKVIGVIGYGSQGHAQALNLRDSGCQVIVGLPETSKTRTKAKADGFDVYTADEVARQADIIAMLIPDQLQSTVYNQEVVKGLSAGKTLMFAHGFSIHYNQVIPPPDVNITMIAPKCPGHMLRALYTENQGPPAIVAIEQNATGDAMEIALAYAKGIGCSRAGVIETTFAEETETDLFGEQSVLCGGVTKLIKAGFDTLVEAGYQPEIAYFEVLHEMKMIIDLIYRGGFNYMRYSVSDTAEYGDYSRGERIYEVVKPEMEDILAEVRNGTFAREWILENQAGRPVYNAMKRMDENHPIEKVGAELRQMMSWMHDD